VNVGIERGPTVGTRAGLGVAAGEATMLPLVLIGAERLTRVGSTPATIELIVAVILGALGLRTLTGRGATLTGRGAVRTVARRITRPTLTMQAATIISPMGLAGWLGLALLLPDGADSVGTASYGLGIILASLLWHVLLGVGSGTAGGDGHRTGPPSAPPGVGHRDAGGRRSPADLRTATDGPRAWSRPRTVRGPARGS
jgi:hypothetical protein